MFKETLNLFAAEGIQCQQEYIVAHFIEKKSYKTIAHEKGISLHNVWKTTARSMRNYIKAVRKLEVES